MLAVHLGPLLALLAERVANLGDEDLDDLDQVDHATRCLDIININGFILERSGIGGIIDFASTFLFLALSVARRTNSS